MRPVSFCVFGCSPAASVLCGGRLLQEWSGCAYLEWQSIKPASCSSIVWESQRLPRCPVITPGTSCVVSPLAPRHTCCSHRKSLFSSERVDEPLQPRSLMIARGVILFVFLCLFRGSSLFLFCSTPLLLCCSSASVCRGQFTTRCAQCFTL